MASDAVAVSRALIGIAKAARDMVKAYQEHESALRDTDSNMRFLRNYLNKEMLESNKGHGEPEKSILDLQELVYKMEDFMAEADRCRHRKTYALARLFKAAFQGGPRSEDLKDFEKKIGEITQALPHPPPSSPPSPPPPPASTTAGARRRFESAPPNDDPPPVGMERPKEEIIELLLAAGGHEDERKVISIVGCAGVGKTTLAKALWYDPRVQGRFNPHCAWVPVPQTPNEVHGFPESLQHYFHPNQRYLVIVDGVQQRDVLDSILSALPKNQEGSRVVVTTSICSVAQGISPGGYLYTMRGLDDAETVDLFRRTLNRNPSPAEEDGLKTFFDKCGGLPLVVVAASKLLRCHGDALDASQCQKVGTDLGNHLAGRDPSPEFEEVRRALARYCHSLSLYEEMMCMFSLSSFPKDDHGGIKTKNLLRRWVAEGLVVQDVEKTVDQVACKYRDKLLDLGVLEPVSSSSMGRDKRCQVHGVTLEYLVHRSVTWNFIALVQEGRLLPRSYAASSCHGVAIHGGKEDDNIESATEELDLSHVRSLIARKTKAFPARLLKRCRMLRVLDLEGCAWRGSESDDDHVRHICDLLHLRYINLRRTSVAEIPRSIKRLHSLVTLDVRETEVDKLPMEVLMLPQLAHLFGRFELPEQLEVDPKRALVLQDFFSKKSKLVTLAGFKIVNSKRRGHELILRHAKTLRKVKIWCELPPDDDPATIPPPKGVFQALTKPLRFRRICRDVPRPRNMKKVDAVSSPPDGTHSILDGLVTSLESRLTESNALESLSVDFVGGHCSHFLDCVLKDPFCTLSSIKVRGRMESLPDSQALMKLRHINKLHLCNTGLGTNELSELQNMVCLVYLKLAEDTDQGFWHGSFVVNTNGFPSLKHLCFDGQRLPAVMFTRGSMRSLLSLQLICLLVGSAGNDLGVTGVANLPCLDEVILHREASDHRMEAWRAETRNHSRRPNVKRQQPKQPYSEQSDP